MGTPVARRAPPQPELDAAATRRSSTQPDAAPRSPTRLHAAHRARARRGPTQLDAVHRARTRRSRTRTRRNPTLRKAHEPHPPFEAPVHHIHRTQPSLHLHSTALASLLLLAEFSLRSSQPTARFATRRAEPSLRSFSPPTARFAPPLKEKTPRRSRRGVLSSSLSVTPAQPTPHEPAD